MTPDPILKGTSSEILVHELLDIMVSDAENSERLLRCLTEDCVWVMEPGGTEYHGIREIRAFVEIAMSSRRHDTEQHRFHVTSLVCK